MDATLHSWPIFLWPSAQQGWDGSRTVVQPQPLGDLGAAVA